MTHEEALRLVKGCGFNIEAPLESEVEKIVVRALERQIPKHIEEQTEDDREFIDYICPSCKTTLQQKMKQAKRQTVYKYKHCIECGQALDWEEAE